MGPSRTIGLQRACSGVSWEVMDAQVVLVGLCRVSSEWGRMRFVRAS